MPPDFEELIARADLVELRGTAVPFASAEDLILHKLFAGRARDLEDARGVVRRKGAGLDWAYHAEWAQQFSAVPGREDLPAQMAELRRDVPNG